MSGGGKTVTYGALIGDKLFNGTVAARQPGAVPGAGEAGRRLHARRHAARRGSTSRTRSRASLHLRPQRPRAGDGPRPPRPAARPGRLRHRRARARFDRRELGHALPGVQVLQVGDFLGVVAPKEYDAIQAAAQLKVQVGRHRQAPRQRQPLRRDARRTQTARRPSPWPTGNVDAGIQRPRRRCSARATRSITRCTRRSARRARSPTSRRTARRSSCERAGRLPTARPVRHGHARREQQEPARPVRRGRRARSGTAADDAACAAAAFSAARRDAGARSSSCAGTTTAGTTTARRS